MYGLGIAQPQCTQILQSYKDVIELTSRSKIRFRQTFFQKVTYKLILIPDPLDHCRRIYRNYQNRTH